MWCFGNMPVKVVLPAHPPGLRRTGLVDPVGVAVFTGGDDIRGDHLWFGQSLTGAAVKAVRADSSGDAVPRLIHPQFQNGRQTAALRFVIWILCQVVQLERIVGDLVQLCFRPGNTSCCAAERRL